MCREGESYVVKCCPQFGHSLWTSTEGTAYVNDVQDLGQTSLTQLLWPVAHQVLLVDAVVQGRFTLLFLRVRLQRVAVRAHDDHRRTWGTCLGE